ASRRAGLIDARRTAGENDAARLHFTHALRRDVIAHDLAEDVVLAHPSSDELAVLRAEVEDQDAFRVRHGTHVPFPNSVERFVAASTASIKAARKPPRSRACRPAMVVPAGLAT